MGPEPIGRAESYIPARDHPRSIAIHDEMKRAWARTAARLSAERREHARKASRAVIRRPMTGL